MIMTWSPNHFFMKVAKRWLLICNNNRFFYLFFWKGGWILPKQMVWWMKRRHFNYITLHYNHAHFKCSTLHFLQYLLVFLRNSQHLQHSLEHSVVQKRNVQTMYLSSCLIKFIETKLNSQDTSNIKRINNCKNVSSLNKIAYQDTFLNFSPYQFEISRN